MMRLTLKRLFLAVFACFGTTLLILALPRKELQQEWESRPGGSFEDVQRLQSRRFLGERPHGLGDQRPLPHQPMPPSLTGEQHGVNPFNFSSVPNKMILAKLARHLRDLDWAFLISQECPENTTLAQHWKKTKRKRVSRADSWERFYADIGSCDVWREEKVISELLHDLTTMPIKHVHIMDGGTQNQLNIGNGRRDQHYRFGRDYESDPNHFYFSDFERHQAEIATFHLDKVLGYRRAVPTAGRIVNITSELFAKAEKKLAKTFFISPAKNHCFVSKCDYYCDTTHAICGLPDLKEGSVQVFLPDEAAVPRKHNRSPYRRTYSKKNQLAAWQTSMDYCTDTVKSDKKYAHGRRLLDLIDLHIMDFLIGNQDRHHYESFYVFESIPSYAVHLDNGRAFGRADFDDLDILLPLRQCCIIRPSTLQKLIDFYKRPKSLVKSLHESMTADPVAPILAYKHYSAIDRRLNIVMDAIATCLDANSSTSVVVPIYHNAAIPLPAGPETEYRSEEESETETKKERERKGAPL